MREEKLPGGIVLPLSHPGLPWDGRARSRARIAARALVPRPDPSPEKLTWFLSSDFSVVRGGEEALHSERRARSTAAARH